jgi:glycosidase
VTTPVTTSRGSTSVAAQAQPRQRRAAPPLLEGPDSVAGRWLRSPYDLDGWRIDVAQHVRRHGADDYYGDVARALRPHGPEVNPDAFLVAEHSTTPAPTCRATAGTA